MAMLGKTFQRTISMSQIGPGSNSQAEKAQVLKYYQLQQPQPQAEGDQPANQWEILKNAEAMMMMMMQATSGSNTSSEEGVREAASVAAAAAENEQHHHPRIGCYPCSPGPNTVCSSRPERHTMSSPSTLVNIPTHHFLDACFYCKRRLHPEKDIFIYRGDAAFCTEECRYRQILNDETHSRASKKAGSTSETAVAA